MPSAGPRSQCACGSKSNARGSPHVRTTTLSASLLPWRDAGVREVGQRHQQGGPLVLHLVQLDAELPNLLRPLAIRVEDGARVLALPLRSRHFVAGRVLVALQPLELGNQPSAPVLQRGQLFELAVDVHAAALQARVSLHPDGRARKPGSSMMKSYLDINVRSQ